MRALAAVVRAARDTGRCVVASFHDFRGRAAGGAAAGGGAARGTRRGGGRVQGGGDGAERPRDNWRGCWSSWGGGKPSAGAGGDGHGSAGPGVAAGVGSGGIGAQLRLPGRRWTAAARPMAGGDVTRTDRGMRRERRGLKNARRGTETRDDHRGFSSALPFCLPLSSFTVSSAYDPCVKTRSPSHARIPCHRPAFRGACHGAAGGAVVSPGASAALYL